MSVQVVLSERRSRPVSAPYHRSKSIDPVVQPGSTARVQVHGKFFRLEGRKWYVRGLTYGPFAPDDNGDFLPPRRVLLGDFARMRDMGANAVRLYHVPPPWLLDEALKAGLRVLIDVPWQKHRCFFEDWYAREDARQRVRRAARLLGSHPATLGISVCNEVPKDIVRYYGAQRVAAFLDELIEIVKEESPQCLATYANYPSTEFLCPRRLDFACFNVYLHDAQRLGAYLDRLQHLVGPVPLILGEFGADAIRNGEQRQAELVAQHVHTVFRHGLAGSFVFSYTDEWFTGGAYIEDWAFGITTRQREERPAAAALRRVWQHTPFGEDTALPRVSVVVCSYNGGSTLRECLDSLVRLRYPDYEVILVDDGSTDDTRQIARQFPQVRYIHQTNQGLSVARNVGAAAATGQIVAYTDSDCIADEDWLMYLVQTMLDEQADAAGGPNIPPPGDGWTAQCVAASPGGPSHVMLDDRRAEHVPGCNMAFRRDRLAAVGGFDPRFRVAGDDVDICWRFLDAGMKICYSPAALVWHKRRRTVRAYLRQQAGYGRAEALLHEKHPHRFNSLGCARWHGIIYGEGAVYSAACAPRVHYGRFGQGLFQMIYRSNEMGLRAVPVLLEWHAAALYALAMALIWPPAAIICAAMWACSIAVAVQSSRAAPLPAGAPWWCRPLVFALHLAQPVVRSWHRYRRRLACKTLPHVPADNRMSESHIRKAGMRRWDMYWSSSEARGREELLASLQQEAARTGFEIDFSSEWATHDALASGDLWHRIRVHTATEELGWPRRFTRARCELAFTTFTGLAVAAAGIWTTAALAAGRMPLAAAGIAALAGIVWRVLVSQKRCLRAVTRLLWRSGHHARLDNISIDEVRAAETSRRAGVLLPAPGATQYARQST